MRVALYVRVSTDGQAEDGYSVEEQESRLRAYCDAREWTVAGVYRDAGYTGSNLKRPGMRDMIGRISAYDAVVVYKLDRLSRSQKDTLHLIEDVFLPAGVGFLSVSENFDTTTPFGKAMIGILSIFAQLEREQIRERMTMGKVGRVKSGKTSAWSRPPFGYAYADGRLTVDPLAASVVRGIFADYIAGVSITGLVKRLNADGHVGKARPWSFRTVHSVLATVTYTGRTLFKGEVYPGDHEAIVSDEDFRTTQSELQRRQADAYARSNNPRPFQSKYPLSGLMRCACGSLLSVTLTGRLASGERARGYRCKARCGAPAHVASELEDTVRAHVARLRLDPSAMHDTTRPDPTAALEAVAARLEAVAGRLVRLADLYMAGTLPPDALATRQAALEDERTGLEAERARLSADAPALTVSDAVRVLETGDDERAILRTLIDHIVVGEDDMVIHWRFV